VHRVAGNELSNTKATSRRIQVHAVVFANSDALAHSMIEFGCGLQRSCAFVRRMSIWHQSPDTRMKSRNRHRHKTLSHADIPRRFELVTNRDAYYSLQSLKVKHICLLSSEDTGPVSHFTALDDFTNIAGDNTNKLNTIEFTKHQIPPL